MLAGYLNGQKMPFYAGRLPKCEVYALLLWPVRGAGQPGSCLGCQPIRGA